MKTADRDAPLGLVIDAPRGGVTGGGDAHARPVPLEPATLFALEDCGAGAACVARAEGGGGDGFTLERVMWRGEAAVIAVRGPSQGAARLGGAAATLVSVLGAGDVLLLAGGARARVIAGRAHRYGTAGEADAERECLVCRVVVTAGEAIYRCSCGGVSHAGVEGAAASLDDRCALEGAPCPACGRAVEEV